MSESIKRTFVTTGMHCPSCSMLIQMNLGDLDGVEAVRSNHETGLTEVVFDPGKVTPDQVVDEIVKSGYGASLREE